MRLSLPLRRTAALAAIVASVGSAGLAGSASAASISTPTVLRPGASSPINFAGYKEPSNNKLPKDFPIVRREAKLVRGEQQTIVMSAPQGFRIVGLGLSEKSQVGFVALNRDYPGRRSTRVQMYSVNSRLAPGETGTGTIYLLARRA